MENGCYNHRMGSGRGRSKRAKTRSSEVDAGSEYINFGDVARQQCHEQCQYASRYLVGWKDWPDLGAGLRYQGEIGDYHSIVIHRDDVEEFVRRYHEHMSTVRR
jgi:hypothetical protein